MSSIIFERYNEGFAWFKGFISENSDERDGIFKYLDLILLIFKMR